ncbi:hypothetical protein PUN28_016058 [Cardiocondyla obscurior]|uniref:Uncharacterized protein n=1 Tax=Cardiocondyla obscurior TaxID=286306 RepID=A0AAW2ESG8_9HYME
MPTCATRYALRGSVRRRFAVPLSLPPESAARAHTPNSIRSVRRIDEPPPSLPVPSSPIASHEIRLRWTFESNGTSTLSRRVVSIFQPGKKNCSASECMKLTERER